MAGVGLPKVEKRGLTPAPRGVGGARDQSAHLRLLADVIGSFFGRNRVGGVGADSQNDEDDGRRDASLYLSTSGGRFCRPTPPGSAKVATQGDR